MTCVDFFKPTYEYAYFDQNNNPQIKKLNVFQCVARRVFGCYTETHLSNVVEKAYKFTLNGGCCERNIEKLLLKAIAKRNRFVHLGDCDLSGNKKAGISVIYNIKENRDKNFSKDDRYRISSIRFKQTFTEASQKPLDIFSRIVKNKHANAKIAFSEKELFRREKDLNLQVLSEGEAKRPSEYNERMSFYEQMITNFVLKIFNDSSISNEYLKILHSIELNSGGNTEAIAEKFGWNFSHEYTRPSIQEPTVLFGHVMYPSDIHVKEYSLQKEFNRNFEGLNPISLTQGLSINFALSWMDENDYR
jgi:hypothetical protein